jgi:quercetin dioxygenase-like cupin family protein
MNRNVDPRDAHPSQQQVIDRRMLITHGLGAATVGALLGSSASLAAATGAGAGQAPDRMPGIALPQGMRRVITGNDAEGQSYIVADDRVTIGPEFPNIFKTTGDDPFGPGPEPEPRTLYPTDMARIEPEVGGANFQFVALPPTTAESPPVWHRTETVDIDVLLGGELILMLDKEETTLHPGDVVIQRNTNHAWKNPGDAPVYWAAVLMPIRQRT